MIKVEHEDLNQTINREIKIKNISRNITYYIDSHISRCTKCQSLHHTKSQCTSKHTTCVRCAGHSCTPGNCKNTKRKCANCLQDHPASFSQCPKLKALQKQKYKESVYKINKHTITVHSKNK